MIILRELQEKDAPFMIEWMHDSDIQRGFQTDMASKTLKDVQAFIEEACSFPVEGGSIHLAIAGEDDEYLGTISLKDISLHNRRAEYAISLRKSAQEQGIAAEATKQLLTLSFRDWGLERVYLNVLSENMRAIHLYEKCGFLYEGTFRKHLCVKGEFKTLKWYSILKEEYMPMYGYTHRGGVKPLFKREVSRTCESCNLCIREAA